MIENTQLYFTIDPTDLTCVICYDTYGLIERQPISLHCGHTVCSACLLKINKCSLCKQHIDKTQQYQKNLVICSLLEALAKQIKCPIHSEPCQGFCFDHKAFICFECLSGEHYGHNVSPTKDINTKVNKIAENARLLAKRKASKVREVQKALQEATQNHKRHLEEEYDEEIQSLSLLKKKLYKEVDVHFMSAQERYEHQILSSFNCSEPEVKVEDGAEVQFLEMPQIMEQLKAEQREKQGQLLSKLNNILRPIKTSSDKLQELLLPSQKSSLPIYPDVELEDFIGELQRYGLTVSHQNALLEVKKANDATTSIPLFNPHYFDCTLTKLSIKCLDPLPSPSFLALCQILTAIAGLQDLTLEAQSIFDPELASLSSLITTSKTLEKLTLSMDLSCASKPALSLFMRSIASLRNVSSFDVSCKGLKLAISLLLNQQSEGPKELGLSGEEISEELTEVLFLFIDTFNRVHQRCLRTFRLFLGKNCFAPRSALLTQCPSTQFLSSILLQALLLQSDNLEELIVTSDGPDSYLFSMLSKFLPMAKQLQKLSISLIQASMPSSNFFLRFPQIFQFLKRLEEFAFKMKSVGPMNEDFAALKNFLGKLKGLKHLCLQFDGLDFNFGSVNMLFTNFLVIQGLTSLELEFLNVKSLTGFQQRSLENILNRLPSSVNKKCVFSRASLERSFVILEWILYEETSGIYIQNEI